MNPSSVLTKEAIVGCAFNYKTEAIIPFLNSLERSGFTGDLILFVNNKSEITAKGYSYAVQLINPDVAFFKETNRVYLFNKIERKIKLHRLFTPLLLGLILARIRHNRNLSRWMIAYLYNRCPLMTSRFFLYYYYLHQNTYSRILFTDVNDVIFQGNPFRQTNNEKVYAYKENASFRIGSNPNNRGWILEGFGEKILQKMADKPIYCAGTIILGKDSVLRFLRDLMENILRYAPFTDGIDQAVFNFMISHQQKSYFDLHENGDHVLTLALQTMDDIVEYEGNICLKGKEPEVPSIIHQYNRHHELIEKINERFQSS